MVNHLQQITNNNLACSQYSCFYRVSIQSLQIALSVRDETTKWDINQFQISVVCLFSWFNTSKIKQSENRLFILTVEFFIELLEFIL